MEDIYQLEISSLQNIIYSQYKQKMKFPTFISTTEHEVQRNVVQRHYNVAW
jgi:hypothetical protein